LGKNSFRKKRAQQKHYQKYFDDAGKIFKNVFCQLRVNRESDSHKKVFFVLVKTKSLLNFFLQYYKSNLKKNFNGSRKKIKKRYNRVLTGLPGVGVINEKDKRDKKNMRFVRRNVISTWFVR